LASIFALYGAAAYAPRGASPPAADFVAWTHFPDSTVALNSPFLILRLTFFGVKATSQPLLRLRLSSYRSAPSLVEFP